jgi:hypothetical protein
MNINLYINYYQDKSIIRQNELDTCIHNNILNKHLNVIMCVQDRMMYSDFFNIINKYTSDDDINIISNLDIFFDDSIVNLKEMHSDEAFVLGRWNYTKAGIILFNRPDSQDTWIFKGKVRKIFGDFYLGYLGCDNRIAHEIKSAGYKVSNPSKTIKATHLHISNIRNYSYTKKDRKKFEVSGPYYTINPCEWNGR